MSYHVALLIPTLEGGGAERVCLSLSDQFVKRGLKVDLVLFEARGDNLKNIPDGVNTFDLQAGNPFKQVIRLTKYIKTQKPDILVSALNLGNIIGIVACFISDTNTKLVVTQHNVISYAASDEDGTLTKIRRKNVVPYLIRFFFPKADKVVSVSKGVAQDLVNIGLEENTIEVIYNPVISNKKLEMGGEELVHPWFMEKSPGVVLGVGSLRPQKDFKTLIKAFAKVYKQIPSKLMILGEGKERQSLEILVQDLGLEGEVEFYGYADNPYKFMKNASVFVLSSRAEGFGLVLAEAMAFGTPVVSTDCPGGPAEILEDGKWGTLVPVGDSESLAREIIETLKGNNVTPEQRGKYFNEHRAAEQYFDLFERL